MKDNRARVMAAAAANSSPGPIMSGQWKRLPGIAMAWLGGTGTVSFEVENRDGTSRIEGPFTVIGTALDIYPFGSGDKRVRATLTGTATAEIV